MAGLGSVPADISLLEFLEQRPRDQHQAIVNGFAWKGERKIDIASDDFDEELGDALEEEHKPVAVSAGARPPWRVLEQNPHLQVQDIPGKGKGVVATAEIKANTLLVREKGLAGSNDQLAAALLLFPLAQPLAKAPFDENKEPGSFSPFPQFTLPTWNRAVLQVMANHFSPEQGVSLLLPFTARFNHNCVANAVWTIKGTNTMYLFAKDDIPAGREINIMYSCEEGHDKDAYFQCGCETKKAARGQLSAEYGRQARRLQLQFDRQGTASESRTARAQEITQQAAKSSKPSPFDRPQSLLPADLLAGGLNLAVRLVGVAQRSGSTGAFGPAQPVSAAEAEARFALRDSRTGQLTPTVRTHSEWQALIDSSEAYDATQKASFQQQLNERH